MIDIATPVRERAPHRWWPLTAGRVRFARYAAGSLVATAVSAVVFALGYRFIGLSPPVTTVAAFVSGALVNFTANRFWAWDRPRRPGLGRDALSYAAISVATAAAATGATTLTQWYALRSGASPDVRAVLVEVSYFGTYSLMFLVKFAVLDRWVFASRRSG